jgi:hypothetical protein
LNEIIRGIPEESAGKCESRADISGEAKADIQMPLPHSPMKTRIELLSVNLSVLSAEVLDSLLLSESI